MGGIVWGYKAFALEFKQRIKQGPGIKYTQYNDKQKGDGKNDTKDHQGGEKHIGEYWFIYQYW